MTNAPRAIASETDAQRAWKRAERQVERERLEATLLQQIIGAGLPMPERQVRFHLHRRWRMDFGWPDRTPPVAIEIQGGTWTDGRHSRGLGYRRDNEKANEATFMGWAVYRFTTDQIQDGTALQVIERVLKEPSDG